MITNWYPTTKFWKCNNFLLIFHISHIPRNRNVLYIVYKHSLQKSEYCNEKRHTISHTLLLPRWLFVAHLNEDGDCNFFKTSFFILSTWGWPFHLFIRWLLRRNWIAIFSKFYFYVIPCLYREIRDWSTFFGPLRWCSRITFSSGFALHLFLLQKLQIENKC